jgi:hypothetical protein
MLKTAAQRLDSLQSLAPPNDPVQMDTIAAEYYVLRAHLVCSRTNKALILHLITSRLGCKADSTLPNIFTPRSRRPEYRTNNMLSSGFATISAMMHLWHANTRLLPSGWKKRLCSWMLVRLIKARKCISRTWIYTFDTHSVGHQFLFQIEDRINPFQ